MQASLVASQVCPVSVVRHPCPRQPLSPLRHQLICSLPKVESFALGGSKPSCLRFVQGLGWNRDRFLRPLLRQTQFSSKLASPWISPWLPDADWPFVGVLIWPKLQLCWHCLKAPNSAGPREAGQHSWALLFKDPFRNYDILFETFDHQLTCHHHTIYAKQDHTSTTGQNILEASGPDRLADTSLLSEPLAFRCFSKLKVLTWHGEPAAAGLHPCQHQWS